jgi:SAM-dependent methyltransferase
MNPTSLRPAYLIPRLRQMFFVRRHPDTPWLTESGIRLLDSWLRPTDIGIEWGSGRSTAWLAKHVAHMTSVEDSSDWHSIVQQQLSRNGVASKVDYRFVPCEHREVDEPESHPYASVADEFADHSLDFALIDGNIRALCMAKILPKLKPGGLLILDNANRYIPNQSLGGPATAHEPRTEYKSAKWRLLAESLQNWRAILTTDSIWDTRFWVKPPAA